MTKIILATVFLFSLNSFAENKAAHKLNLDRIVENYNNNLEANQAITFARVVGTNADAKLMQQILKSSKENALIKAEKIDETSVKIGDKMILKFEQEKMFVNGYEVNFTGKKSLVDRIEYLQRIMKFNESKKKVKTSWIQLLIPNAEAAEEYENKDFARRLAASASSMWNWWLYDRYEYGNPEQFQSFQALIAIPDKIDLEVDCKANPSRDESFKGIQNYNPDSYLGRQNVMGEVRTNFPIKLTYTKPNGEPVVMWITDAGTAGVSIMDGVGAPRHVNVVRPGGKIESLQLAKDEVKSDFEFKNDTSTKNIARALVKCCERAESGKASCLSSFKGKLDKKFQTNKEGQRTIRETTQGVSGVSN